MADDSATAAYWIDSNKRALLDVLVEASDCRFSDMSNKKSKWQRNVQSLDWYAFLLTTVFRWRHKFNELYFSYL